MFTVSQETIAIRAADPQMMLERAAFVYDAYYAGNVGGAGAEAAYLVEAFKLLGNTARSEEFARLAVPYKVV